MEKFFKRSFKSIYSTLSCETPIQFLHSQILCVYPVLGRVPPALLDLANSRKWGCDECQREGNIPNSAEGDTCSICWLSLGLEILGPLVSKLDDRVDFFHVSFREYLCAVFVADELVSLPIRDKLFPLKPDTNPTEKEKELRSSQDNVLSKDVNILHEYMNPNSFHSTPPNPAMVRAVEILPNPLPHFEWHRPLFLCSPFWRNVYVFAANSVSFGFLFVANQMLKDFSAEHSLTRSEGLSRSFGAMFSSSFLPLMWGSTSNPREFVSTYTQTRRFLSSTEDDRNRLVCTSVATEHCLLREANPVWEYAKDFGLHLNGKKGSLIDLHDSGHCRFFVLFSSLFAKKPCKLTFFFFFFCLCDCAL
jgi:hypothetical protein